MCVRVHTCTHPRLCTCACVLQDLLAESSQHVKRSFKQNKYSAQSWKSACKYRWLSVCGFEDSYEPVWVNTVTLSLVKLLKNSLQKNSILCFLCCSINIEQSRLLIQTSATNIRYTWQLRHSLQTTSRHNSRKIEEFKFGFTVVNYSNMKSLFSIP